MLEIRLLRYFLAVVDEGSVTKASGVVRVAQPSVSRQLHQLEVALGVPLFEKVGGRLRPTAAGRALLPMARDLVARADTASNIIRGMAENQTLSLSLLAPVTTVADVIAPFLAGREGSSVAVNVREALPSAIFGEVASGEADLGISSGTAHPSLATRSMIRFPIWAYAPPGHPLTKSRSVRLETLVQYPLIQLGQDHGTRRLFDDAVTQMGLTYHVAADTNVPQVAQAFAAAGRGIAILTDDRRYGLRPLVIETPNGPLSISLFAAWDPTHYAAGAIETLVDELATYMLRRFGVSSRP